MLCLSKKICSYVTRIRTGICNDHELARARQEVDTYSPKDLALCLHHKSITRPKDLIHSFNCFSAVGHRSDCLNASNFVDLIDSYHGKSSKRTWGNFTITIGRCADRYLWTLNKLSEHSSHDHSRNKGDITARDIKTNTLNRIKALTYLPTLNIFYFPVFR